MKDEPKGGYANATGPGKPGTNGAGLSVFDPLIPGFDAPAVHQTDRIADQLFEGHLAILSVPWPTGRWGTPECPWCNTGTYVSAHYGRRDAPCPWIVSARACGVA